MQTLQSACKFYFCIHFKVMSTRGLSVSPPPLVTQPRHALLSVARSANHLLPVQRGLDVQGSDLVSGRLFFLCMRYLFSGLTALLWYSFRCCIGVRHQFYNPSSTFCQSWVSRYTSVRLSIGLLSIGLLNRLSHSCMLKRSTLAKVESRVCYMKDSLRKKSCFLSASVFLQEYFYLLQ